SAGAGVSVASMMTLSVPVGAGVSVAVATSVLVTVGAGVCVFAATGAHGGAPRGLLSRVTEPVWAKARPMRRAWVCRVIEVAAKMFPASAVLLPRVAELTSRHHTLHGLPPTTLAVPEVIRSAADLKIQTPDPLRVIRPDRRKASA